MSDRITALRTAACATVLVTMFCAIDAHGRQNIVANDPITLTPTETKPASPAHSPPAVPSIPAAASNDSTPAHAPPFITLPPALRGSGPLIETKRNEIGAVPLAAAADATSRNGDTASNAALPKPSGESKPLGRANSTLSARPIDEANQGGSGFFSRFDPRNNDFIRVLGALAVVIGLLLLVRSVVRRMGGGVLGGGAGGAGQPSGVVEILARFPVARGQQLILLKLARRIILLHQSGTSMTAISEMTDPDEVASLLARMEAGSSGRGAAKFKAALSEFEAEHQALVNDAGGGPTRVRRALLPELETEIVDLTRGRGLGFETLFGLVRRTAR